MRYLVVDRSTSRPSLALFEEGACAVEWRWDGEPSRAPHWMDDVRRILAERRVAAASLTAFVCGLGPGSFSGIRACLSALSGLALPDGRPVYGVASSAALALGLAGGGGLVSVVGDARRERLWCVTYEVDAALSRVRLHGGATPAHTAADFRLLAAGEIASAVPDGARVATPDWERLEPVLRRCFAAERLVTEAAYPRAADLGALALRDPQARVLEPMPIYLHPAVAERPAPAR